jgi:hypothetical protein
LLEPKGLVCSPRGDRGRAKASWNECGLARSVGPTYQTAMKASLVSFLPEIWIWLFFRPPSRGWRRQVSALALATIALIFGALQTAVFSQAGKGKFLFDDHAAFSLEQALVLKLCGKYGFIAEDGKMLGSESPLPDVPFLEALVAKYGSVAAYCDHNRLPFLMNESSLFLVSALLLTLPPVDTAKIFVAKMTVFRCALVLAALYLFAVFGVGCVPLAATSLVSFNAIAVVQQYTVISIYPTMLFLLVLSSAVLTALIMTIGGRHMGTIAVAGVAAGLTAAAIYNFRTSYGFAVAVQLMAALAIHAIWNRPRLIRQYLAMLGGVAVGFYAFQAILIWPLQREGIGQRGHLHADHVVWHPIVLGLALPEQSALTEREGIRWWDPVGQELAQRIDPNVRLLGPNYDATLRAYYFNLWKNYPSEMLAIYDVKIRAFGGVVIQLAKAILRIDRVVDVKEHSLNGYAWFGALSVAALLSLVAYPLNAPLAVLALLLTVALLCLSAEQAIVIPVFAITHQAALPVCLASLGAIYCAFAAMLLSRLRSVLGALPGRWRSSG